MIAKLPKPTADELLTKYREIFKINEKEHDLEDINKAKNSLEEFAYFYKKVMSMLNKFMKLVESQRNNMNVSIANYKIVMNLFAKYEESNLLAYADGNEDRFIVKDEESKLEANSDELIKKYQNPFHELFYWIKGEVQDIETLHYVISYRETFDLGKPKAPAEGETPVDLAEATESLKKIVLLNLSLNVIPKFKKEKLDIYHQMM